MGVPSGVPSYMLEDLCLWFIDDRMSCGKESLIQATSVSGRPGQRPSWSTVNDQRLASQRVNGQHRWMVGHAAGQRAVGGRSVTAHAVGQRAVGGRPVAAQSDYRQLRGGLTALPRRWPPLEHLYKGVLSPLFYNTS